MPLKIYEIINKLANKKLDNAEIADWLGVLYHKSLASLSSFSKKEMISLVRGKKYFSFQKGIKLSRPVNKDLFKEDYGLIVKFLDATRTREFDKLSSDEMNMACYSIIMSLACAADLINDDARKLVATFFEKLIGFLVCRKLGVEPQKGIMIPNPEEEEQDEETDEDERGGVRLPIDFCFDLGKGKPKIHLPVKTSTRERLIDLWAHQLILDKAFPDSIYLGIAVLMNETKRDTKKHEIIEICQPKQLKLYQRDLGAMTRIYYLDPPARYVKLNKEKSPIIVKPFGDFFSEADKFSTLSSASQASFSF